MQHYFLNLIFNFGPGFSSDWVGHGGFVEGGVIQVGIDLGGVEIAVAQNLL